MASKYGSLRETEGHCKFFLKETASYHDRTMEHPLMQSIYDLRVTDGAYARYLQSLRSIFRALETERARQIMPATLVDPQLFRSDAIDADLDSFTSPVDRSESQSPAVQQYFGELMQESQLFDQETLICHHFLHYNAILSGGAFLGGCLKQMGKPSKLYEFHLKHASGGASQKSHQYVRDYMHRLDAIPGLNRQKMASLMRRVYELTEAIMDEAQALQPEVLRVHSLAHAECPSASSPADFAREVSLEELGSSTWAGERVWISIGGRVLDVTSSSSYAPGGAYGLFAGHDVSKCLGEMSLDEADLDDLEYDARASCTTWGAKLGRVYPAVGTLTEFPVSKRLPESIFVFDSKEGKVKVSSESVTSDSSQLKSGSCPFPFIFLHDPKLGWRLYHQRALDCTFGAMLGFVVGVFVMWMMKQMSQPPNGQPGTDSPQNWWEL
eukprot:gene6760-8084_t